MKKFISLFIVMCALIATQLVAQDALVLDPNNFVNDQILGDTSSTGERLHTVYQVERNNIYFFDGRLDIDFPVEIIGPEIASGSILTDDAEGFPPTLANVLNNDGNAQQFFTVFEPGYLVMKNLIMSGTSNDPVKVTRVMVENTSGTKFIADNVVFTDWEDFCIRNREFETEVSVTNCVFINGLRLRYSQWGGMVMRLEPGSGTKVTFENNTVVNSSRLMCNAGPFLTNEMTFLHNTAINMAKNAFEMRQKSVVGANNIFMNWEYAGYTYSTIESDDYYGRHFTTGMEFSGFGVEGGLDAVASYFGQNLFYRSEELLTAYAGLDSAFLAGYWEFPSADSFSVLDDNFKIGTNYEGFNPEFTTPVGNDQAVADWAVQLNTTQNEPVPEMRIPTPLSFDATTGAPSVSWPPAFDLSYSNTYLQTAGTDGLPLGDLNWFPAQKATYMANRDTYVAALIDSQSNAKAIYVPGTYTVDYKGEMIPDNPTPMITPETVDVEREIGGTTPNSYYLSTNYPNPFNPSTTIKFGIPEQANVTLSVFNILGQKVFELTEKGLAAGSHSYNFDASSLSSGIYIYNINAVGSNGQNFNSSKKMTLLK